ncbi:ribosome silencing factor [Alkalihalobacillus sp. CinArs1]|uniref:ribosome silencing factor n=1 Tax=Alkalihalobacillus sp. CinArs1 TaxID=2995314 RepID=UPI0022DD32E3|nr:ribosome silencing factor [Alkalihalobacillus sp. CinArs1]
MEENNMITLAAKAVDDKRAEDIIALNMNGISLIADYFLICHGNSEKQVQAIAKEVKDQALEQGLEVKRLEGYEQARWVLVDLGSVIVHIFHKDERNYYNLEKLWGDAPHLPLNEILA